MGDWNQEPVDDKLKRRGVIEQREKIPGKRRKVEKLWTATHGTLLKLDNHFANFEEAVRYIRKVQRSYSMHPATGKPWGSSKWTWRIKGPDDFEISNENFCFI